MGWLMLNEGVSLLAVASSYVESTVALITTVLLCSRTHARPSQKGDTVTACRAKADRIPHLSINETSSRYCVPSRGGLPHS